MNFFTDENIIDPLMKFYKDFNYVNYIMNLPFKCGFKLYLKCLDNLKDEDEKDLKNKMWNYWLIKIQNGYSNDFDSFYKSHIKKAESQNLDRNSKKSEEKRIIEDIEKKQNKKMKKININNLLK